MTSANGSASKRDSARKAFPGAAEHESEWDDFFRYNPASRHRRRILHGLIASNRLSFERVLDVGCGDGRLLEEMHKRYGCQIYGIEVGQTSCPVRLGEKLSGFYKLDIQKACIPERFDLLLCTELLEHMSDEKAAACNLARMCKQEAYLLVTVPAGPMRKTDIYMGHVCHYTQGALISLLSNAGFITLECFAWGNPFHSLYRKILDIFPKRIMQDYAKARYTWKNKLLCQVLYYTFFLNSYQTGNQLFYLGKLR